MLLASSLLAGGTAAQVPPPNDQYFSKQWYLNNTGLNVDTGVPEWKAEADIQILDAWAITRGNPRVLIVTVDTGADLDHQDLYDDLLTRGSNEDWDFYCDGPRNIPCAPNPCTPDLSPDDLAGHGSRVGGIAAAVQGNAIGISGVAPDCQLMPLRVRLQGGFNVNRANAIHAAADKLLTGEFDAVVINCSWEASDPGTNDCCIELEGNECDAEDRINLANEITRAYGMGAVIVCAAGNKDPGENPGIVWPASMTETIAVGASDACDYRWSYLSPCPHFVPPGTSLCESDGAATRCGGVGWL